MDADVDAPGTESSGKTIQIDLTTGWTLGESFYLGLNTSLQQKAGGQVVSAGNVIDIDGEDPSSFFGVAVYPKFIASDAFSLGLRAEYFAVKNSHLAPFGLDGPIEPGSVIAYTGDGSVIAATLSANYKIGGLTLIPEFRIDKTSEDSYTKKDGSLTDMIPSLTLAAVYKF